KIRVLDRERKAGVAEAGEIEFALAYRGDLQGRRGKVDRLERVRFAVMLGHAWLEKQERDQRRRRGNPANADRHPRLGNRRIDRTGRNDRDEEKAKTKDPQRSSSLAVGVGQG